MNCQEFWDGYPELEANAPGGHASECADCARRLEEQQALAAGLQAAAVEWRTVQAPARVESGLVAAFRSQQSFQRKPARVMWWPVLTWASAAAVLVMLAVFAIRGRTPQVAPHPAHRASERASIQVPAAWIEEEDSDSGEFIPLPNTPQVGENEDVNVVRVEVPRSAMMAVGLPVSMDRVSELVEADVMLGSDGLARAVRFVNE